MRFLQIVKFIIKEDTYAAVYAAADQRWKNPLFVYWEQVLIAPILMERN